MIPIMKTKRIYPHVAGKTFGAHEAFLKYLTSGGAQIVNSREEGEATIVFCPIVTHYVTDLNFALSSLPECAADSPGSQKLILVAMHHTCHSDYTTPSSRELDLPVALSVNCLFHENKGLLRCGQNTSAKKKVLKELDLDGFLNREFFNKFRKNPTEEMPVQRERNTTDSQS